MPPESIWVTYSTTAGNLVFNDKGSKVYADDSTSFSGWTRITIPSFSGSGTLSVNLKVSGVSQGSKTTGVRTTDPNADGRDSPGGDQSSPGDIDWSGSVTQADYDAAAAHLYHWKRNALHGTPVRRTNFCDYCPSGRNNTIGSGDQAWSWDGIWLAYSARDTCPVPLCPSPQNHCRIKVIPADPARGNVPITVTFNGAPGDSEDYDPSWSPTRGVLFFVRKDRVIYRKGAAEIAADTSLQAVIGSSDPKTYAELSPDGDSLAYVQYTGGYLKVFISPATGGSARQLTTDNANYLYPKWSPDGAALMVTRYNSTTSHRELYKLRVRAEPQPTLFHGSGSLDVAFADFSPDTQVVLAARGATDLDYVSTTLDNAVPSDTVGIANYREFTSGGMLPKFSPDGTRTSMIAYDPAISGAPQIWATRRNMSLPPRITSVGASVVADTTTTAYFHVNQGTGYSFVVAATDPEGDALTYQAFFLQSWMTWTPGTQTLSMNPSGGTAGSTYGVVLHVVTPSGGADYILARFTVCPSGGCGGLAQKPGEEERAGALVGANPTRGPIQFATPMIPGAQARLLIFDIAGRRVASVRGRSGAPILWDATREGGGPAPNGVYLYRLMVGPFARAGRVVLIR